MQRNDATAVHEIKVIVATLIKVFEFYPDVDAGAGGKIDLYFSSTTESMPFVSTRKEDGPQVPLRVRCL